MTGIEKIRDLHERAAGEAFLPEGWQALVAYIGPLLDVAEAAHALVGVTTHANIRGPEYAERKLYYQTLRLSLGRLEAKR